MPKTPLLFLVASVACALALGVAAPARGEDPAQPQYVTASGPVVAVSVDSVTVGSLRCSVPAEKLADFTALHLLVGQPVKLYCAVSGDRTVLLGIARGESATTGPQSRSAEGPIAAVSDDSITVGTLTCALPAEKLASLAELHLATGRVVKITCVRHGDAWVLTGLARVNTSTGDKKHALRTAKGLVTELTATSITIKTGDRTSLTCSIAASFELPSWVHVGSRVRMACRLDGGRLLLVQLRRL